VTEQELPSEFLEFLQKITGKRARVVIDHILKYGYITTEDLETTYKYTHPPRAVRDVREQGVPIETFSVKNTLGRTIAAYRFGDFALIQSRKIGGRKIFSKLLKQALLKITANHCAVCGTLYESRYLQIDHRIPYEVAGNIETENVEDYMPLCGSCNRAKSWSCEHCENGVRLKNPEICQTCYWASPINYNHIAMRPIRRLDISFTDEEISLYETIATLAQQHNLPLSEYVKQILKQTLGDE
jgi:5-methylcytosine-specific restriction endonuclease McrA